MILQVHFLSGSGYLQKPVSKVSMLGNSSDETSCHCEQKSISKGDIISASFQRLRKKRSLSYQGVVGSGHAGYSELTVLLGKVQMVFQAVAVHAKVPPTPL